MGGRILLADDSITIQKVVELTFAETEHEVIAVGGGRDLLRRLPEVGPDVVLCDVVMPDMNGYDVCQSLKSDPATLHIPVVLLTGTFEPFDRDRAVAAGCDAIVTKPFEARELINIVDDLLKRAQAAASAPAPAESGGLGEMGIADGVPALDFSTSGFEKMVPLPPPEAPTPDNAIELTASAMGQSYPKAPPPAPPELREPAAPEAVSTAGGIAPRPAGERQPAVPESAGDAPWIEELGEAPVVGRGVEDETAPRGPAVRLEQFPVGDEEPGFPVEPSPGEAPFVAGGVAPPVDATRPQAAAPLAGEGALTGAAFVASREEPLFTAPPPLPLPLLDEVPHQPEIPVAVAPPPSPTPAVAAEAISEDTIEAIARRVIEMLPPLGGPSATAGPAPAVAGELDDAQVDAIARRVLQLAAPQIERIAWEVIPDVAEMLIRKRIVELEKAAEDEN